MHRQQLEREARWLLEEKYQGKLTKAAKRDIARLKAQEPIDYLIGFAEFAGCAIDLSQKPLIPRPETEYWTQKAIGDMRSFPKKRGGMRCLDMFAGSGCVGVAVLRHILKARVDFAEKERKFLQQIRLNLKKNRVRSSRARVIQSDVFSNIPGRYDSIFANPPYIAETRRKRIQDSVVKYEPHRSLFAGRDGLTYVKLFLKEAKHHLNPGGNMYVEFDPPQRKEIDQLFKKLGYKTWQFYKDQYGKWRFVVAA